MTITTTSAPLLHDLIPAADLKAEIDDGWITRKTHPTLPLSILTYSRACQYDRHWTPATIRCRGLVVEDTTGRIVARPFDKFWNVGEYDHGYDYAPALPDEPFEIFDKVDGSLSIVFHYGGAWRAASKGSFISEQAVWSQAYLDAHDTSALDPTVTYLAETLYPENVIVVRYGDRRDLVLLAALRPDGEEIPLARAAAAWAPIGSVVRSWPALPLSELMRMAAENQKLDGTAATGADAEGWVIRFRSGLRAKAKLAEYTRLHRIVTGINARDIWRALAVTVLGPAADPKRTAQALNCAPAEVEAMRQVANPLEAILDNVPDEFDQWVRGICADLTAHVEALEAEIEDAFHDRAHLHTDRGAFARSVATLDPAVRAAMFLRLDGKDLALHLWRNVKPENTTPFRDDEEG